MKWNREAQMHLESEKNTSPRHAARDRARHFPRSSCQESMGIFGGAAPTNTRRLTLATIHALWKHPHSNRVCCHFINLLQQCVVPVQHLETQHAHVPRGLRARQALRVEVVVIHIASELLQKRSTSKYLPSRQHWPSAAHRRTSCPGTSMSSSPTSPRRIRNCKRRRTSTFKHNAKHQDAPNSTNKSKLT